MISQLRVTGAGKDDAVAEFTDGLNIIRGRSNTGKTWILKCIYYLFGSDRQPYSRLTGYTDIEGTFQTSRFGTVVISRKLGEKAAYVTAESPEVEDGDYITDYRNAGDRYLNDLWLRIIGMEKTIRIPKNSRYSRVRMSWANIANVFFVDEHEIAEDGSIVLRDSVTATKVIASLQYLLTGDYKEGCDEILSNDEAKARKDGLLEYIDQQRETLKAERARCLALLEELSGIDVESEMATLADLVTEAQEEIDGLLEENSSLAAQIADCQKEDASRRVLLDRYESLVSQYKADLTRLDFISKGEKAVGGLPANGVCPFCGGELHPDEEESYTEAIEAEARRISSELAVIVATEESIREEQEAIQGRIAELAAARKSVNAALGKARRSTQDYRASLEKLSSHATLEDRIAYIDTQLAALGKKEVDENKKKKKPPMYHAKDEFQDTVGDGFDTLLNKILKECNYNTGAYASWSFTDFDILLDSVSKSEGQGQGYCSFLNSVVALMLYDYFNRDGVFIKPGFLMVDTPLLGFDEIEDDADRETLKMGLYNYFVDHQGDGQVIVVDNLNVIPSIDFEGKGVNVITYHKDERDGHTYGFMPSWRNDLPKEPE